MIMNYLDLVLLGGSNGDDNLNDLCLLNLMDYTAFEVFAHDYDIPVGECEELGGPISIAGGLSACMGHHMIVRTTENVKENLDVIIDWGDGTIEKLSDTINENIFDVSSIGKDGKLEYSYRYHVGHIYSAAGKYIIKIYGKNYYSITTKDPYKDNTPLESDNSYGNIICRVFDKDLPIASHIRNLSSFCNGSRQLLYVDVSNSNFDEVAYHADFVFANCRNLLSAKGFSVDSNIKRCGGLFFSCLSLTYTDFSLPKLVYSCDQIFYDCRKLKKDISEIFSKIHSFPNKLKAISVKECFLNCYEIYGTVPEHLLWNNKTVNWTNTSTCFKSYIVGNVRSNVPVSWGGTNESIDKQLKIDQLIKDKHTDISDYTAFEVYPTDTTIPNGELTYTLPNGEIISNTSPIKDNMTHLFVLRTTCLDNTKSDVIVDWGDGIIQSIANGEYEQPGTEFYDASADIDAGEAFYTMKHTYSKSGRYIVKIYGKQYYSIKSYISDKNISSNLISRIFEYDLPLASHLINLSSICYDANRLLYVNVEPIKYRRFNNLSQAFYHCQELQYAIGFKRNFAECAIERTFLYCDKLIKTDLQLPSRSGYTTCNSTFAGCTNLAVDINKFIPDSGLYQPLSLYQTFRGCVKLYGTISDFTKSQLWNNPIVKFTNQIDCFLECSDELRAQIPASWGGTASDDIIKSNVINSTWIGTNTEYDSLEIKNTDTLYLIKE